MHNFQTSDLIEKTIFDPVEGQIWWDHDHNIYCEII